MHDAFIDGYDTALFSLVLWIFTALAVDLSRKHRMGCSLSVAFCIRAQLDQNEAACVSLVLLAALRKALHIRIAGVWETGKQLKKDSRTFANGGERTTTR